MGIVNSEEGYQNLVRFLFGDIRIDGILELDHLPLPPSVQRAKDEGKKIRASYWFEASVSPRPSEGESHTYSDDGWRVRCNHTDEQWGERRGSELEQRAGGLMLPIESRKGLRGRLNLKLKSA